MSEVNIFWERLETLFPVDRPTSPREMEKFFKDFFEKRGIQMKASYLRKEELTEELISRIRSSFDDFKHKIRCILNSNSEERVRNKYYEIVYAVIDHNHYGIANVKNNRLKKISFNWFAETFELDRKTVSNNFAMINNCLKNQNDEFNKKIAQLYNEIKRHIFDL